MPYEPNQAAQRIIKHLEDAGFTLTVPDLPERMAYVVTLNHPDRVGRLWIGASSGSALRLSITNVHTRVNKLAEKLTEIEDLLRNLP